MSKEDLIALIGKAPLVTSVDLADPDLESLAPSAWPRLPQKALYGIAGSIVELATQDSEADPAAVLLTTLTRAAASFGKGARLLIGDTPHPPRVFTVLVGASSRARKGTSYSPVARIFSHAEEILAQQERGIPALQINHGPLSSGEGLIHAVRDPSVRRNGKEDNIDEGVVDKRLLVLESEFGAALKAARREGNTLSAILRTAWDSGDLSPITKNNPVKASNAHICILGHITITELELLLSSSDIHNGFANRILWGCAQRRKQVAIPSPMEVEKVVGLAYTLSGIICFGQEDRIIEIDESARRLWIECYPELTKDTPGRFGSVTARAEAQVLRLAMTYCLLDREESISLQHLEAALALWSYCRDSARLIFGNTQFDPTISKIINTLKEGEKTQTQLYQAFKGHINQMRMNKALNELQASGLIQQRKEGGQGRSVTIWSLSQTHRE